jgi:type VI protein secretion system component VasF
MSAAESKAVTAAASEPAALVESQNDSHETHMEYNESSRVPWWVVFVWAICITGFIWYLAKYLFPDLALWGAP